MKLITLLVASISVSAFATNGTPTNPEYRQCSISLPEGETEGVCVENGSKHIRFLRCGDGATIAFVEPGALPITYKNTCGPGHVGFNPNK